MNSKDLGAIIRARRKTLGLDQRSLAEIASLSVHSLSDIESGKANPTLAVINQVSAALGMELALAVKPPGRGDGS